MIDPRNKGVFISPERLYQTKEGVLCSESDLACASLVVAKGCAMSLQKARALGLLSDVQPETAQLDGKAFADWANDGGSHEGENLDDS